MANQNVQVIIIPMGYLVFLGPDDDLSRAISGEYDLVLVFGSYILTVRRHINWNNWQPDLREDLAHLVQDIKRRICGIASAGLPWFSV